MAVIVDGGHFFVACDENANRASRSPFAVCRSPFSMPRSVFGDRRSAVGEPTRFGEQLD
jgi:hypothetical protein